MGGVSGGSTYKEMVAGHESGAAGYDAIYGYSGSGGDPSIAKSHGGKNLSELSIREALKIGDSRMDRNAGALGKYQFLPNTLREMLPLAGLTENDPFNPENQEKLMDALIKYNSSLLQSKGIEPTDVNLGLAHHVGVGGAIKLLKAEEKTPNVSAADILQLSKKGKKTNPELEKPVGEFLANLRKHYTPSTTSQAKVNTTPPKINGNQTKVDTPTPKINANKLNENSKENISLNTPSSGAVIIMDQTTVNNINGVNKPPQVLSVEPKDDRPLTLRAE
jgi:hypothetical protein